MKTQSQKQSFEARWPVALTIVFLILLLSALPDRIIVMPAWFAYSFGIMMVLPVIAVGVTKANDRWLRIERTILFLSFVVLLAATLTGIANLVDEMLHRSTELSGVQLLSSSIAGWISNIVMFSLLYWQIDQGGPAARMHEAGTRPDWLFSQNGAPDKLVPPEWKPEFADYLFLAFTTATAFSPTDTLPLTTRAKMLMMVQSSISLIIIVIVAARAINILGG